MVLSTYPEELLFWGNKSKEAMDLVQFVDVSVRFHLDRSLLLVWVLICSYSSASFCQ